jgi:cytochrome c oxidase assembly protein subunit 15
VNVQTSALVRARSSGLSARAFVRLAGAAAGALYLIVLSGATVRLTASGLGCESWPGCQAGAFFPESDYHGWVEFGNRFVSLFPIALTLLAWLGARRTAGLPRWVTALALATFVGTIAQAPLGLVTIVFDLHPLLVMSHFLLALLVLAGGVVVLLAALEHERGRAAVAVPRLLPWAGLALAASGLVLVVTGMLATAAGPHSGSADIRRLGNLFDAVYVHVRATAVFGVSFLLVLAVLVRRRNRARAPFLVALGVLAALLVQMAVGEIQWRNSLPWGVVLVHVALAAAVWAGTVALVTLLWRPVAVFGAERT